MDTTSRISGDFVVLNAVAANQCPFVTANNSEITSGEVMHCNYCQFEGPELSPSNEATTQRLASLRLEEFDFSGKTVLDIGTNSGLVSLILASQRDASVLAIDIQKPMIDALDDFVAQHNIPNIETACFDFMKFDDLRKYDFVFFLEVLHWAVHQGYSVLEVVKKVSSLTSNTLFIEFPWDINEPAIVHQTQLTEEQYSAHEIFKSLTNHFREVRISGFQTYFDDPKSRRALVFCKK